MSKRQHSSTASESNLADTSIIDLPVFETPNSNKQNKQTKKRGKKSKTEQDKTNQKSMADFVTKTAIEKTETSIETRLDEICSKLSNVLTKNDTSLIKNIIKETLEEIKEKFLGSVLKKLEIMEGSVFEHKNEIDALKKQIKDQKSEIDAMKEKQCEAEFSHVSSLNDLEQYGRRNSIRISGLPNDTDQQSSIDVAEQSVNMLNQKLGLRLGITDVDVASSW
ncbi:hypothetical protein DPMN_146779 [Dreissena polymorpha]|uniref:Uncharacterized protein n=1 Tax=Dreissena polymorpha TaxID=45954 RepID=A0A9D4F7Q0_DREPO|nr:hypothetical protein DPMN_146779 [Dreissena polymorpha]